MSPRPLRVEQALELLPDLEELIPLREALIGASRSDQQRAWSASESYATVHGRVADAASLEAELPRLVARVQERVERVYGQVVVALRAIEGGDAAGAASALIRAGEVEEEAGRLQAADGFYGRAADLGRKPRDRKPEGLALRRRARVARSRGELERSRQLYERSHAIAEAERHHEGMVVACQGAGNVLAEQGRWEEAESWYLEGLGLVMKEDSSRLRWELESNLSAAARRAGRLDDSEGWLRRARDTVEELGDDDGRVYVSNAEGLLQLARGDPMGAEGAYRDALRFARSPAETARVLVNLAESLLLQGRTAEAETLNRDLEQIAVTHRLIMTLPYVYRGLGAIARARRDEDGFVFFEQALQLCRERELPRFEVALTQKEYAAFEADLGRVEPAIARLSEARSLFETLGTAPELRLVEAELAALNARSGEGNSREDS